MLLEPDWNPDVPAKEWKATLYSNGMPVIVLNSTAPAGGVTMATFDDTCGNWVMISGPA